MDLKPKINASEFRDQSDPWTAKAMADALNKNFDLMQRLAAEDDLSVPLSPYQVTSINIKIVNTTGGTHGVRDEGLLESALLQPYQGFGDLDFYPEVSDKAACYLFGLIENHPFMDANKRTACVTMNAYLNREGATLDAADTELYDLALGIAAGEIKQNQVANWMRVHVIDEHLKPEELEYVAPELVQETEHDVGDVTR